MKFGIMTELSKTELRLIGELTELLERQRQYCSSQAVMTKRSKRIKKLREMIAKYAEKRGQ